jgi:hypothetical protein
LANEKESDLKKVHKDDIDFSSTLAKLQEQVLICK